MKKLCAVLVSAWLVSAGHAIESAGTLYVDLQARDMAALGDGGQVGRWTNRNESFGHFSTMAGKTLTNAIYQANVEGAQAIYFDGTVNSALVGPSTPAGFAGQNGVWSMEVWIMQPNLSSGSYEYMAWTKRRSASGVLIEFRYGSDGNCVEHYGSGFNFPWGTKPSGAMWHHVAITRGTDKLQRVYCDGYLVNTMDCSNLNIDGGGSMVLGSTLNTAGSDFDNIAFNGYLGAVRVHSGTLTAEQVISNYQEEHAQYHSVATAGTKLVEVRAADVTGVADGFAMTSLANQGTLGGVFTNWASGAGTKYVENYQGAPAFYFDGTSNTVMAGDMTIPDSLTGPNTTWTVESWVLRTSLTNTADYFSWTRRTGIQNSLMEFRYDATLGNALEHHTGNLRWGPFVPPPEQWQHLVFTRDASRVERVYVNGVKVNEQYLSYLNISSDTLAVLGATKLAGENTGFLSPFKGYVGQLRVTTGAKSAADIYDIFKSEVSDYLPGTSSVWHGPGGGNWSEAGNWSGTIPDGADKTADFSDGGEAVTNDLTGLVVQSILLGDAVTRISGNEVTLASGGVLRSLAYTNTVSAPLALEGRTTTRSKSGHSLVLAGDISGSGGITHVGGTTRLTGNNTFTGPLTNSYGTIEFDRVAALGASSTVLLGEGSLRYTGSEDAEISKGITSSAEHSRYGIIDVTDAAATLTISGKIDIPEYRPVIKRGSGRVELIYDQAQTLNGRGVAGGTTPGYTADGTVDQGVSYGSFVVEDGILLFNGGAGQVSTIRSGANVYIGTKYPGSPKMIVDGSTVNVVGGNWTTVGRGTGTTTAPQSPELVIINGGRFTTDHGVVLSYADGQLNYYGTPKLTIDNGYMSMNYSALINEDKGGYSIVNMSNNSVMENNQALGGDGILIAKTPGGQALFTVTNSILRANNLSVHRAGKLILSGNSSLETESTGNNTINDTANLNDFNQGYVEFDGATLTTRRINSIQQWFHKMPQINVGPDGMCASNDYWASLDAVLVPVTATDTIFTKKGPGLLGIRPAAIDVNINAGSLYLYGPVYNAYAPSATPLSSITMNGGLLETAYGSVFHNKRIEQPTVAGSLALFPFGLSWPKTSFQSIGAGASLARSDGWMQIVTTAGSQTGGVMLKEKQSITNAWTASFTLMGSAIVADGFAFVIHNDARGITALGASGHQLGYAGATGLTNSIAIGFDFYSRPTKVKFGRGDGVGGEFTELGTLYSMSLRDGMPMKTYITLSYDGSNAITITLKRADGRKESFTKSGVNLADITKTSRAYVGITAGTGGSTAHLLINDFVFDNGSTKASHQFYGQYSGTLVAAANGNIRVQVNGTTTQKGFGLATLSYETDSSITVSSSSELPAYEDVAPDLVPTQSAWQLNGNAEWRPNGALRLSYPAGDRNGAAFLKERLSVTNAWKATFSFDIGITSTDPADWVTFTLQNVGLDLSFSVKNQGAKTYNSAWSVTDGGIWSTRWNYYKNNRKLEIERQPANLVTALANPFTPLVFNNTTSKTALMTLSYNPAAKTVTVRTVQGENVLERYVTGVEPQHLTTAADGKAYVGFSGRVGGSWAENLITSFTFEEGADAHPPIDSAPYLAFDRYDGSGILTKQGNAPLALLGDLDYYPTNSTIRLSDGGLMLRRINDEPLSFLANRTEWIGYAEDNTFDPYSRVKICRTTASYKGAIACKRRVNVAKDFTVGFRVTSANAVADGWALVFHNDPRGPLAIGDLGGSLGYRGTTYGISKSVAIMFSIYNECRLSLGINGSTAGSAQSCIELRNRSIDTIVRYNYATKTVTVIMTDLADSTITGTYTFTDVDIPAQAQSNYAHPSMTSATGGETADLWVSNWSISYDRSEPVMDERLVLQELQLPAATAQTVMLDTPDSAGAPFLITTGTFGIDAKLQLSSSNGGQLKFAETMLAGANAVDVGASTTNYLASITGTYSMTKDGPGVLIMQGEAFSRLTANNGLTDISGLATDKSTIIRINNGAMLKVNDAGAARQAAGSLYVDGQKMKSGYYNAFNSEWITGEGDLSVGAIGMLFIVR
ncbi:MAG: hypothetical protein PHO37_03220 [Kiritimatiellae bacterium]|nr:hypothetical protein [Kiritimatiellia bacterium]